MKRFVILFVLMTMAATRGLAVAPDTLSSDKTKKGWNLGVLPSVLFNSDLGLQYGLLANVFNFGDGAYYPDYRYSFYTEWSRTTKGGGINQFFFDSKYLLPWDLRITADLSVLTQQALDFYGFNGYESRYNASWEDRGNTAYVSRMYYRLERELARLDINLQKPLKGTPLSVLGGAGFFHVGIAPVNLSKLNRGLEGENIIPDTAGLYERYTEWGLIGEDEKEGGKILMVKAGMVYDTRDQEANPMKGIWSEALIAWCPSIDKKVNSYSKLVLIHSHYFTLVSNRLSIATRMGYQGTLWGKTPFYMQPYMINSFPKTTTVDGLGGSRTIRGILRNRVVGDGIAYGNLELRWKVLKTYFWRQNFYLALSAFADGGQVVKSHPVDWSRVPEAELQNFRDAESDHLHMSWGLGLHFVMNQNFVIAVDYGKAFDSRDGKDGLYIGLNFLF